MTTTERDTERVYGSESRPWLAQAFPELPSALRTYWKYRPVGFMLYYNPLWSPYVFGTLAISDHAVPYMSAVAVGLLILELFVLVDLADRFADVDEDRVLHPQRTDEFLASLRGAQLFGALLLGSIVVTAALLGLRFSLATGTVAAAFGLLNVVEDRIGKPTVRVIASSIFGTIPIFIAFGMGLPLPVWLALLSFVMLTAAQLAWSWLDDGGDCVRDREIGQADMWLARSRGAFAVCAAAGIAVLWKAGGASFAALVLIPLLLATPYLTIFWSEQRHQRAVEKRMEPRVQLRWADGSSWEFPFWHYPLGFPVHVFAIIALGL